MNINFVRKNNNMAGVSCIGENVLEIYRTNRRVRSFYTALNYDPEKNTVTEISPEIKKFDIISVQNCIYNTDSFYFATYKRLDDDMLRFIVYMYSFSDGAACKVLEFKKKSAVFEKRNKIKIFILNSLNILVQEEIFTPEDADYLMGIITFELTLYNTDSGEGMPVEIPDLKNNGINNIVPITEKRLMVKTGYSFIEDARLSKLSEKESLIESVYLTSAAQFIADMSLNSGTGNMELIETSYFDKCIISPRVRDDFIYYIVVDVVNECADMNFFNFKTQERYKYKLIEDDHGEKHTPMVICNTPYVRIKEDGQEYFMNLVKGSKDMAFTEESCICALGSLLLFSKTRHNREYLRIYSYPRLKLLCEQQCSFSAGCYKDEEYYIYF